MRSDPGRVRRNNEDACALAPELGAYVLCDGMGGAAGGEIASRLAVESFLKQLAASEETGRGTRPQLRLEDALLAANRAVLQHAQTHRELLGMGTTMVALLYVEPPAQERRLAARAAPARMPRPDRPPDLHLLNVGDSRCYRLREGSLVQLSTDHSFVEEQLRAGQITAEQALSSPMRNYVTRAVGPSSRVEADLESYRTQPGDLYLLCSDGLSRELQPDEMAALLLQPRPADGDAGAGLAARLDSLIGAANDRGGNDNITAILVLCP